MKIHKPTKNIIEYCGEENGLASIILFVHDWGVRFGYVGIRGQYANDVCDCFNHQFPCDDYIPNELEIAELINGKDTPMFVDYHADDILDKIYSVMTSTSIIDRFGRADGFQWVGYDCGHVCETYDKDAIRRYYPDEADNLIKKFSLRYTNSSPPVIRSLDWCKEKNTELARVMYNTQKAYIADFQTVKDLDLTDFVIANNILMRYTGKDESVVIPNNVTEIGTGAFFKCKSIKYVTIPNSVTRIGENAFRGCTGLESITLSHNLEAIKIDAFWGCTSLENITIPDSVNVIETNAFSYCYGLKSVELPFDCEISHSAFPNKCSVIRKKREDSTKTNKTKIEIALNDNESSIISQLADEKGISFDEQLRDMFYESLKKHIGLWKKGAGNKRICSSECESTNNEYVSDDWGFGVLEEDLDLTEQNQNRGRS